MWNVASMANASLKAGCASLRRRNVTASAERKISPPLPTKPSVRTLTTMPGFFFVLCICVVLGVGLYVLSLLIRFVKAHERIAGALERRMQMPRREG
jgi:hypothetical protein